MNLQDLEDGVSAAFKWVEINVFPFVPALLALLWPAAPPVAGIIVGMVPDLMAKAEATGASGPAKKDAILAFAKTLADDADRIATGGAKQTWDRLLPVLDLAITQNKAAVNAQLALAATPKAVPSPLPSSDPNAGAGMGA